MPVICIKLDRVPRLSDEAKANVRMWLNRNKSMGAHNVPRRFRENKSVKCTVISDKAFSKETHTAIVAGT